MSRFDRTDPWRGGSRGGRRGGRPGGFRAGASHDGASRFQDRDSRRPTGAPRLDHSSEARPAHDSRDDRRFGRPDTRPHHHSHSRPESRPTGRPSHSGPPSKGGVSAGSVTRYHDQACAAFVDEVKAQEDAAGDMKGVQTVKVTAYIGTDWELWETLSKDKPFYYNFATGKTQQKKPADVAKASAIECREEEYAVKFAARPAVWPTKGLNTFDVRCNAWQVTGPILSATVFEYTATFEPDIAQSDAERRRAVLFDRRGNGDKLRAVFGEFSFDNTRLFALGGAETIPDSKTFDDLHDRIKVTFIRNASYPISDKEQLPLEQCEALLNIFNRSRLLAAGFTRIGSAWFEKGRLERENIIRGRGACPDVSTLRGFDCSIRLMPPSKKTKELAVLKVDTCTKLIEADSINARLERLARECHSEKEFQARARKELVGEHFLITYWKRSFKITGLDFSQNEHSTFDRRGVSMSYADYLATTYKIKSPQRERCVIMDKKGCAYLPQHCRLTMPMSRAAAIGKEIHARTNPRIGERFRDIDAFVQKLKRAGGRRRLFEIGGPVSTRALSLSFPRITFKGRRGEETSDLMSLQWSGNSGFLGKQRAVGEWTIIHSACHRRAAGALLDTWNKYCSKRRLDPSRRGMLPEPCMLQVSDVNDEREWSRVLAGRSSPRLILMIIDDAMSGSATKAMFTRFIQKKAPIPIQFIKASTCTEGRGSAALGAFDDIMAKAGNVLFRCQPQLPFADPKSAGFNLKTTWMIGVDVSHNGGKPSVVNACLMRFPLNGSVAGVHCKTHLQTMRKEIMGYENARALYTELLREGIECALKEKTPLPSAIFVYRDAVADSQLRELSSKEVAAVRRAVYDLQKAYKKRAKGWVKPEIEYLMCSRQCIDRFALFDPRSKNLADIREPCAVFDHVMSYRLFDFVVYPYHPKKADKCRPVRFVVLHDGLGLAKSGRESGAINLMQLTFALSYVYPFSIPFPLGGTSQPAPIQFAKHYAEMGAQMIFKSDRSVDDVRLHKALMSRPRLMEYEEKTGESTKKSAKESKRKPATVWMTDGDLKSAE